MKMARKQENFFYKNFKESIAISHEASEFLKSVLLDFNSEELDLQKRKLHEIEHRGDAKKHEMTSELVRAFITPIERDDIFRLSQNIDEVTDAIEDILMQMYINNITVLRDDVVEFANILIQCTHALQTMLAELENFKKSKNLRDLIIEINHLEEVGDEMYSRNMRRLMTEEKDPVTIIAWREIYEDFEKACDACEDVASVVESIIVENT